MKKHGKRKSKEWNSWNHMSGSLAEIARGKKLFLLTAFGISALRDTEFQNSQPIS